MRVSRKGSLSMDATRLSLGALERIRSILERMGKAARTGAPITARELAAREELLGPRLPPSYVAVLGQLSSIGEPEDFLDSVQMAHAIREISSSVLVGDTERYVPFASLGPARFACFDQGYPPENGELRVVEVTLGSTPRVVARNFADWLDVVAEGREEQIASAAEIPHGLRALLVELGFHFEDPIVGRLETGDVRAIEALLGPDRTREARRGADRLFDSSGKASLSLDVDEFTLTASLRTGVLTFAADEVFRWLREFRDENFFGDAKARPSHEDDVRDLRVAPREPPLVVRGVLQMVTLPARGYTFRTASGRSADDFHLLGRAKGGNGRAKSAVVHVVRGQVRDSVTLDEAIDDLYVTDDGVMWGLSSSSGRVVRFSAGASRSFALAKTTPGRASWRGIGGDGTRVLVWGAGALLQLVGDRFAPFAPDPELANDEAVIALSATATDLHMLVYGDEVGAVAHLLDGRWLSIPDEHVIEDELEDLDVWQAVGIVLGKRGDVWRVADDNPPEPVRWDKRKPGFLTADGTIRVAHAVRGYDGGALLASNGGVIVVGSGEPVFHSAASHEPLRLARVGRDAGRAGGPGAERGPGAGGGSSVGIVATCGPNAWLWRNGTFEVLDLREW